MSSTKRYKCYSPGQMSPSPNRRALAGKHTLPHSKRPLRYALRYIPAGGTDFALAAIGQNGLLPASG